MSKKENTNEDGCETKRKIKRAVATKRFQDLLEKTKDLEPKDGCYAASALEIPKVEEEKEEEEK